MIIEQTPVLRLATALRQNKHYTAERSDISDLKKSILEEGLKRYVHILEDDTAVDGIGCIEAYKELYKETNDKKYLQIPCYLVKDITEEEIPNLIKALNTIKIPKAWELCEKALKCLQPEQQGKDLGGTNRWDKAIKDSGVKGISGKTLQRYHSVKEYDKKHPEKGLLPGIQDPDPKKSQDIGKAHAEIVREKRQKINDEKIKKNGDRKHALDKDITVPEPKHFCEDNFQLYNQSNTKPWLVNDKIQLLFFSPPYLNQRNYEDGILYKPQKLYEYLQQMYFAVKEGKKHLAKTGIVGINIGDAYKFGANYITLNRIISALADKLGLYYFYKMIWRKLNGLNSGKQEGKKGRPQYDYEEIVFFSQDENYTFEPIKYYTKDKIIDVTKTGGRHNPDGSKTEYQWGCSPAYEMFHQFIDQQHFHDVITTAAAGSDSKLFRKYGVEHPAMMPLVIPLYPILCFSNPGDLIADCYAGSGTTLATGLLTGRRVFGIEKEERFFDPMCKRIVDTCQKINPGDAKNIELRYIEKFKAA